MFELFAYTILELLRAPVDMFTPEEPCPLEVSLLDELVLVDVDELVVGEEIVMFKNGFRKCQKIASDPLGWKIVKKIVNLSARLLHLIFSLQCKNLNRFEIIANIKMKLFFFGRSNSHL